MKTDSGKIRKLLVLVCVSITFHLPLISVAQYKVTHLEAPYNTAGSETGAIRLGDTVLAYASMPPSISKGSSFSYDNSLMQLQQVRIAKNGKMARPKPNRWGFNHKKDHTGNLAVDPVSHDAYFTRGDVETLRCDIWWAQAKKRRGWEKPAKLGGQVNDRQYTATHPTVGRLADGSVILYFVSDRPGGYGGMDIWYALVKDGVASAPVNLGPMVNSSDDEITPFYDQRNGILYFSSDRAGGKGGLDIYCAVGQRNTWQQAEAVCGCLNSEQNDIYFSISDYDSASGFPVAGYLSSNRKDSYFLNDSMCCNDLYRWSIDSAVFEFATVEPEDTTPPLPPIVHTPQLPLSLYFHNDDPDPGSRDTTTQTDYADCLLHYALLRSDYMAHQRNSEDSAAMQQFFDTCVAEADIHLYLLLEHIENALGEGKHVVLTVAGFASPLHTDSYNLALSQRRIGSFVNMLRTWHRGALSMALADGRLRIVQHPKGIDRSTQPTDTGSADAVYSLQAALSRRIEICSCDIF